MSMLWRGTHKFRGHVTFLGGTAGIVNIGAGTTYWVDGTNGDDDNSGTDPNHPLITINAAIGKCTDWEHDYIFVFRKATSDFTMASATPILMNKHTVHLIGVANPTPQGAAIRLVHTDATDNVLEFPQDTGYHCEVAGFGFAGGATGKGGIAPTGSGGGHVGAWIHHCNFGGILTKGTPDFGIHGDTNELMAWTIEDCSFYGSGDNAKGLLAVDGINTTSIGGSATCKHLIIRNNIFMGIPGVAINMGSVSGVMIIGNHIKLDAATGGAGITLGAGATGCWVSWNDCNFGSADVSPATNSGYTDASSTDANTWSSNWAGGVVAYPA
jgi:hypothetical protein